MLKPGNGMRKRPLKAMRMRDTISAFCFTKAWECGGTMLRPGNGMRKRLLKALQMRKTISAFCLKNLGLRQDVVEAREWYAKESSRARRCRCAKQSRHS